MSVRIAVNGYLFSPGVLTLGVKLILNRIETEFVVPAMRDQAKKEGIAKYKDITKKNAMAELAKVLSVLHSKELYYCHNKKHLVHYKEISKQDFSYCKSCRKILIQMGLAETPRRPKNYYKQGSMSYAGIR